MSISIHLYLYLYLHTHIYVYIYVVRCEPTAAPAHRQGQVSWANTHTLMDAR